MRTGAKGKLLLRNHARRGTKGALGKEVVRWGA